MFTPPQQSFPGQPNEPFVWGRGGKRMTPEDIEIARQLGLRGVREGADYSPVAHWTQGLARASQGWLGALQARQANKAGEANAAESDAVIQALLAPDAGNEAIIGAITNPHISDQARGFAEMEWKRRQPKVTQPPEIIELAAIANDPNRPVYEREAAAAAVRAKTDPLINTTLPGDRFYSGPQSGLATAMGGGGQASGAAPTGSPPAEAIADLRANPASASQFDEIFGPGAAARILGQGGGGGGVTSTFLDGL